MSITLRPNREPIGGRLASIAESLECRMLLSVSFAEPSGLSADALSGVVVPGLSGNGVAGMAMIGASGGQPALETSVTDANGNFTIRQTLPLPSAGFSAIQVADFNGDGTPDIAVVDPQNVAIDVYFGNRDGTFTPESPTASFGTQADTIGYYPDISVGDFNGDGKADVAIVESNASDEEILVLTGNGKGGFTLANTIPFVADYVTAVGKSLAMVEASFTPEITIVSALNNSINPQVLRFPKSADIESVNAADLDNTGSMDLIVCATAGATGVTAVYRNVNGRFYREANLLIPDRNDPNEDITYSEDQDVIGDFNGDGFQDIGIESDQSSRANSDYQFYVYLNNGHGRFSGALPGPDLGNYTDQNPGFAVANFGGSSLQDIGIVAGYYLNASSSIAFNTSAVGGSLINDTVTAVTINYKYSPISDPPDVIAGYHAPFSVRLQIANSTTSVVHGPEKIDLTASDGTTSFVLATASLSLNLGFGQSFVANLQCGIVPADATPSYQYEVNIHVVTASGDSGPIDSGQSFELEAPSVDLSGIVRKVSSIKSGKPFAVTFDLANNGISRATGSLPVEIDISPDGNPADATMLAIVKAHIDVPPYGESMKVTVSTNMISPPGAYELLLKLDPNDIFHDSNPSDNTMALTITVS